MPFPGGITGGATSGRDLRPRNSPMSDASIIGIDLAKNAFRLHAVLHDGSVVFRKKLTR